MIFRKLLWLADRRRREAELRAELEFHLAEEAADREAAGAPADQARRAALRELGNRALVAENTRAVWGWTILEQLAQDIRYTFRSMAANRLFTVLAVLSLALGIGANTAIYSFVDAILVRALPVPDPQSLVVLNWHAKSERRGDSVMYSMSGSTWGDDKVGVTSGMFPYPAFELLRRDDTVFSSVFAHFQNWQARRLNVAVRGQADIASGWSVSGDYFRGLGLSPAAGRLILPDDDRPGNAAVAVVSYAFSRRRFGAPENALGQPLLVNNVPFTVIGVAPSEFFGVDPSGAPDLYMPMHANELLGAGHQFGFKPDTYLDPHYYWIQVMARLRPGVTLAEAQARLAPMFQQWIASTAQTDRERANLPQLVVKPGAAGLDTLRRRYSQPLYLLLTLVALILALACANIANLLLARAAARRREIALRLSVGASRWRLVRQLLTESIVLSALGGALGVCFAIWGIRFLTVLLNSGDAPALAVHAELNWPVLGAAAALSLLTGLIFGLAPALRATRVDVMPSLKSGRTGSPRGRLSHVLIAAQVSISLLLVFAAGLFVRTLSNLESIDVGFDRKNVLLFQVDARKTGHTDPEISAFYAALRDRFRQIPGVRDASLAEDSLIQAGTGYPLGPAGAPTNPQNRILRAGPDFFRTMRIPILVGRDLEGRDRRGAPAVAVVNEAFVKENFGDRNALHERLILWKGRKDETVARDMEIVGICRNSVYGGLTDDARPVAYIPYDQGFPEPEQMVYALRTAGDPLRFVGAVRDIVRQADARVPVAAIRTQVADIDQTISQEITFARLCTGFAILALAIACVGLYGTVSYSAARRTSEIGIRMALGAPRARVVTMILKEILFTAALGLAIGIAAARTASKFVESFLYGAKANDPRTLAAAVLTLIAATVAAAYLPARKASRIDPMTAVRHE
jgi:macrolide transport system ATP-binding/permease protein